MRKTTQRFSAIVLSLAMVLTAFPLNFVYATDEVVVPTTETAAVEESQNQADVQKSVEDSTEVQTEKKTAVENKASQAVEQNDSTTGSDNKEEKIVTIKSIKVAYADGKPVENGHELEFARGDKSSRATPYTVENGKISNVELIAGVVYKVGISWDTEWGMDHAMAFAEDGFLRVAVNENSTQLMKYDTTNKKITDVAVTKLYVKEYDGEDPEVKPVTIPYVQVKYINGKDVEDGNELLVAPVTAKNESGDTYTVKDGRISNLKLMPGYCYKIGTSWDSDWGLDHALVGAVDAFVRVAVTEDSKTLMQYDWTNKNITKTAVKTLLVKDYDEEEPVRVPKGKTVNVGDIQVVYEDGTPVSDDENMEMDLICIKSLMDSSNYYTRYKVNGGKLSGLKMEAETQYKIGFDTTNKFWKTHEVVGAYNSNKLMRIYARYEGLTPFVYDYDEGIDADEQFVNKIVVKKVDKEPDSCARPSSCWVELLLSDNGYYAESGFSWKVTRLDTGKSKTLYNREGSLTVIGEEKVDYLLTLDENDTYEIDFDSNPIYKQFKERGGIPFHYDVDNQGKYQVVLEGYNVEDAMSRLNYNYIDLKRIDGKTNSTGHKFSDDICGGGGGNENEGVKTIYAKDIVTLKGMQVNEVTGSTKKALDKDVTFVFYDSSTQTVEKKVTAKNGILPNIEMYKDHRYIVYAEDTQYEMPNYYIQLSKDGGKPTTYKTGVTEVSSFDMTLRETPLAKPEDAARVNVKMPVYYGDESGDLKTVSGVKVRLVNQYDTVEVVSDKDGNIEASLMEDYNYMVLIDDEKYSIESFPLTVKDKSEYGYGKYTFNHFSCGSISSLFLVDKGTEHDRDVMIVSSSKNTTVTGLNFGNGSYFINDRVIDQKVAELEGKDYEVVDVDAVNMYRTEISKLSAGDFVYTRVIPEGKKVANVYYIDGNDKLQKLDFTESNGVVTFKMGSVSLYNNVIEYADETKPEPGEGGGTVTPPAPGGGGGTVTPSEPSVPSTPSKDPITNNKDNSGSVSTDVNLGNKVNTENGKADVKLDKDLADKVVENATANKSESVVLNVVTSAGNAAKTEVAVPTETLKDIDAKTDAKNVTIKTDNGSVSIDKTALKAITEQAGSAEDVKLVVETKESAEDKVVIELKLVTSNGEIHDFKGGKVTVTVPIKNTSGKKLVAVYIDDNGKYTKIGGELTADKKAFVFETGHFSQYAVMTEEAADAAIKAQEPEKPAKPVVKSVALTSVKAQKKAMKVTWKKSAKKVSGYQVRYSTSKSFKTCKTVGVKYTKKVNSRTVKSLKSGKRYYVKVRTYVKNADGTYCSKWSKVKSVKVK